MLSVFALTLRELAELLLIAEAMYLCLLRNGRADLLRPMVAGGSVGLGLALVLATGAGRGWLDERATAIVSVVFALLVIALTSGMLSSATLLRRRVEDFVETRLEGRGAPWAIGAFAAVVSFREFAEIVVFIHAFGQDVAQHEAGLAVVSGVAAAGGLAFVYRLLRARLTLLQMFGVSTLLMSALSIHLLLEGLSLLLTLQLDAGSDWQSLLAPFLVDGALHQWVWAALMLWPVVIVARRWWHGASSADTAAP